MVQDKSWDDYLKDFEERKAKVFAMGGEKQVARQHERGKLTARERIDKFFDPGTFDPNADLLNESTGAV